MQNNRETWLNLITNKHIRPFFQSKGYTIPSKVRMSCAFTSSGSKGKSIGECWNNANSQDETFEIFITPKIADSSRVVDILIHELCHATVGLKAGHKKPFADCAKAVGLTGKMTATTATDWLKAIIADWVSDMGEYPHAELTENNRKKQTTRMIKCVCGECGYTVRLARKWLEVATPDCPNGNCDNYSLAMTPEVEESEGE
jgi:hypothetical protein